MKDTDDLDPETLRELLGVPPPERQDAVLDVDEIDADRLVTDTELYEGESGVMGSEGPIESLERLEMLEDRDLRSDETSDPNVASEEGLAWIPPVDPPVVPADNPEGLMMAAGFAPSAGDISFDRDQPDELLPAEDEFTDRVRDALRADSATTAYADVLEITTDGGTVWLRGTIEDIEDDDNILAVVEAVPGVRDVVDELEVAGL